MFHIVKIELTQVPNLQAKCRLLLFILLIMNDLYSEYQDNIIAAKYKKIASNPIITPFFRNYCRTRQSEVLNTNL